MLDEPTGALDEVSRRQVLEVIRRRAAAGTAFLVVTHDVTVARQLCARTCVLYGGRVMELAPTSELLTDPRHPYSRGLIRSFRNCILSGICGESGGARPPGGGMPVPGPVHPMHGGL